MKNIKIGIGVLTTAILGGLILGAVVFANPNSDKNQTFDNNKEQAYIQDEIINKPEYVQDEILVKYKGDNKPFRVIKVANGKIIEKVKEYKGKANVVYAEPNYILYAMESTAPNDTHYANWQWALNNTGQYQRRYFNKGTPGADINWEPAWTNFNTTSFSETIIAILDTGVDGSHPDLTNKLVNGWNFIDDNDDTKDVYEHGVHVAGIAGAQTNNGIGIAGVAFADNIEIMPVKVLGDNGCSDTGSVAEGIRYAANSGAKVINLSLGGTGSYASETLTNAVNDAWNAGVLIVAAAGNDGREVKRYPASYENVMSVAATDNKDNRASFSNFNDEIDISAPGVKVLSTLIYTAGVREYGLGTGTSMACPHVAGLAGLLFAQDNSRSNADVRAIIEQTADDLGDVGWDKYFGHGKINVYAALTYVPSVCGNGIIEGTEECDGILGEATCQTLDYSSGNLSCSTSCTYDTSNCVSSQSCGDGYCAGIAQEENCYTCPEDCRCAGKNCSRSCCGDENCQKGETSKNCPTDCL